MKVIEGSQTIELTRTNLRALLAKLDGHPPNSACTIGGHEGWYVRAVEDDAHYSDRPRGEMHEDTEAALIHNETDLDFCVFCGSDLHVTWDCPSLDEALDFPWDCE